MESKEPKEYSELTEKEYEELWEVLSEYNLVFNKCYTPGYFYNNFDYYKKELEFAKKDWNVHVIIKEKGTENILFDGTVKDLENEIEAMCCMYEHKFKRNKDDDEYDFLVDILNPLNAWCKLIRRREFNYKDFLKYCTNFYYEFENGKVIKKEFEYEIKE